LLESFLDLTATGSKAFFHHSELTFVLLVVSAGKAFETLLHVFTDLGDDVLA